MSNHYSSSLLQDVSENTRVSSCARIISVERWRKSLSSPFCDVMKHSEQQSRHWREDKNFSGDGYWELPLEIVLQLLHFSYRLTLDIASAPNLLVSHSPYTSSFAAGIKPISPSCHVSLHVWRGRRTPWLQQRLRRAGRYIPSWKLQNTSYLDVWLIWEIPSDLSLKWINNFHSISELW